MLQSCLLQQGHGSHVCERKWCESDTTLSIKRSVLQVKKRGGGKAVPLQAWSGPEGSIKLRFPDYMTTAQDGGKVVSLTHRSPLPPGNAGLCCEKFESNQQPSDL